GARLRRSGERTPIASPAVADAAMRALRRARDAALRALNAATVRLHALLLRHALRDPGRAPWGPAPRRWLSDGLGATPAPPLVFPEDGRAVTDPTDRRERRAPERHAP